MSLFAPRLELDSSLFLFNDTATTEIYTYLHTLALHDALPIWSWRKTESSTRSAATDGSCTGSRAPSRWCGCTASRSEEHTSELQSLMRISYAVFCLKKKKQ